MNTNQVAPMAAYLNRSDIMGIVCRILEGALYYDYANTHIRTKVSRSRL
jgi:hypothetical protein